MNKDFAYNIVVITIAFVAVMCTCCVIAIAVIGRPIPQELVLLASTAFAPLTALLVPTRD